MGASIGEATQSSVPTEIQYGNYRVNEDGKTILDEDGNRIPDYAGANAPPKSHVESGPRSYTQAEIEAQGIPFANINMNQFKGLETGVILQESGNSSKKWELLDLPTHKTERQLYRPIKSLSSSWGYRSTKQLFWSLHGASKHREKWFANMSFAKRRRLWS